MAVLLRASILAAAVLLATAASRGQDGQDLPPALAARFAQGVAALKAGQLDAAEAAFRDVLTNGGGRAFVHHNLGLVLRERGKVAEALAEFRRAATQDPAFGPARLLAGASLLALGRPGDAIPELERAVDLMPREVLAHLQLADAYERMNDIPRLVDTYRVIVALAPGDAEYAYRLGRAYLKLSKWSIERARRPPKPESQSESQSAEDALRVPAGVTNRAEIDAAIQARAWDRAERLLAAEIERAPRSTDLLTLIARIFILDRKPLNAAVAIKKAEAIGPIDNRTRLSLALAYISLGRGDWARPELERLAASDDSQVLYPYWLARIDYDDGKYAAAIERLKAVLARDPAFMRAYDNLGLCYEAQHQPEPAIRHYREAIRLNRAGADKSPWPPLNLGVLLRQRGELTEADALLHEAIDYDGSFARAHYELGLLLEQRGDRPGATRALERAAALDSAYAEPHYALARLFRLQGRAQEADNAIATFRRLQRDSKDSNADAAGSAAANGAVGITAAGAPAAGAPAAGAPAAGAPTAGAPAVAHLIDLARAAYARRDFKQTLGYLAHARDLEPRNAGVHFFFGLVCIELNLGREAYESLKTAVSLEPANPFMNYALGAAALHRHEPSEALPYFETYTRLRPDDPRGRFALGVARFTSSQLEEARGDLEQAARHPDTAAGAHYFLGRIARQLNDLATARRELDACLRAQPAHADAWAELGLVQTREGQYAEAERSLARALAIDADHYAATLNLAALYGRMKDPRRAAQEARLATLQEKRAGEAQDFLRLIQVVP
jgi:tetratricopeptide (TPR) repeat protein